MPQGAESFYTHHSKSQTRDIDPSNGSSRCRQHYVLPPSGTHTLIKTVNSFVFIHASLCDHSCSSAKYPLIENYVRKAVMTLLFQVEGMIFAGSIEFRTTSVKERGVGGIATWDQKVLSRRETDLITS